MGPVETGALRAAASALPLLGKKVYNRRAQAKLVDQARDVFITDTAETFVEGLGQGQLRRLEEFVLSPQFGHVTLQAFIWSLSGDRETADSALREQLRGSLRLDGIFAEADLTQATDVLVRLIYAAIYSIRSVAASDSVSDAYATAIAGQVTTAAVRNSELLQRIRSLNEINTFAEKMRSQVGALNAKLRLPKVVQSKSVGYADLYVTPTLHDRASGGQEAVDVLARRILRSVIVGDPGAGKSTLASKLAHDVSNDRIPGLEGQVPLLFVVRKYTQDLRDDRQPLLYYLERVCRSPCNVSPPADALEYLLLNGRMMVIIDGVDELGNAAHRAEFARMVEGFALLYPLTRIVVTSRSVGYYEAPLDEDLFPIVRIQPFDDRQVSKYAHQWFRLDRTAFGSEQEELAQAFIHESSEVKDLRVNPLMLSLLCVLYSTEHSLPSRRPEIYERCAEVLFEMWDRSREIVSHIRYRQNLRPIVQRLAWHIFNDRHGRQELPRSEVSAALTAILHPKFRNEDEAAQAALDFLDFCAGRAWVLTEVGSDALEPLYGFTHRTFLEFFAASQLIKHDPEPTAVWALLRPHLEDSSWELVSQIAVQILDRNRDDGASQLLRLVLSEVDSYRSAYDWPDRAIPLVKFAARCLDNVVPDYETLRGIIAIAVELACAVDVGSRRDFEIEDSLKDVDGPLIDTLLGLRFPDTLINIPTLIADALHRNAAEMPLTSSAGVVFSWFYDGGYYYTESPVLQATTRILQNRDLPVGATLWQRLLFKPSRQDVQDYGVALLYADTYVEATIMSGYASNSLRDLASRDPSERRRAELALEELYPAIVESDELEAFAGVVHDPGWAIPVKLVTLELLQSLSPPARASVLLLLLPEFASGFKYGDGRLRCIGAPIQDASQKDRAMALINRLQLPVQAHDLFVGWIHGRAGIGQGGLTELHYR